MPGLDRSSFDGAGAKQSRGKPMLLGQLVFPSLWSGGTKFKRLLFVFSRKESQRTIL